MIYHIIMPKTNSSTTANLSFESQLWAAADALRSNMDAAIAKNLKESGYAIPE